VFHLSIKCYGKTRPHRSYCFLSMFKLRCKRHYRNLATYSWCTTWREHTSRKRRRRDADIRSAAAAARSSSPWASVYTEESRLISLQRIFIICGAYTRPIRREKCYFRAVGHSPLDQSWFRGPWVGPGSPYLSMAYRERVGGSNPPIEGSEFFELCLCLLLLIKS